MKASRIAMLAVVTIVLGCATLAPPQDTRRSGFLDMGAATQTMQSDDTQNPAMLAVKEGEDLWSRAPGSGAEGGLDSRLRGNDDAGTPSSPRRRGSSASTLLDNGGVGSCASCHGEVSSMKGVAARYPAWDAGWAGPVNLATRINACRVRHQASPAWPAEHPELLALEAFVGLQSRGMPIAPPADERLTPFRERGAALFQQRIGQLDLSCMQCHEERAGGRLAASVIPQGHATGYPIYRLEWQAIGSLGRRIRGCMTGVRAEPLVTNGVEMVELELHLAMRAMGMKVETPGVRP